MIAEKDDGELACGYRYCKFYNNGICGGGLYQCPNIAERARACLPRAIQDYERLKDHSPCGEDKIDHDYWAYCSELERKIDTYRKIISGESKFI